MHALLCDFVTLICMVGRRIFTLRLWFGRARNYWPYRYLCCQAPEHNPIISKLCNLSLLFTCAFKLLELIENPSCIILGTYWLNTRYESELDAMLIGPVKVKWIPITHEFIGVDCLPSCNYYKDHGRICWSPSVLMNLIRPQCVVAVVKHLKVLATCRKYGTRLA